VSPNPSPRPPATTISVTYEQDVVAAAEALLVLLRRPAPPDTRETGKSDDPGVTR
jgi:hypothetical protein